MRFVRKGAVTWRLRGIIRLGRYDRFVLKVNVHWSLALREEPDARLCCFHARLRTMKGRFAVVASGICSPCQCS
jgi:hypothetical protein